MKKTTKQAKESKKKKNKINMYRLRDNRVHHRNPIKPKSGSHTIQTKNL